MHHLDFTALYLCTMCLGYNLIAYTNMQLKLYLKDQVVMLFSVALVISYTEPVLFSVSFISLCFCQYKWLEKLAVTTPSTLLAWVKVGFLRSKSCSHLREILSNSFDNEAGKGGGGGLFVCFFFKLLVPAYFQYCPINQNSYALHFTHNNLLFSINVFPCFPHPYESKLPQ